MPRTFLPINRSLHHRIGISSTLSQAFVDHYYATFDSNRAALGALYTPEATLSFEGQKSVGQAAILTKLTGEQKKKSRKLFTFFFFFFSL